MKAARYSLSFTTGGLFLHESVQIAAAFLEHRDWQNAIDTAVGNSAFSPDKAKSMQRVGREIANRLANLETPELEFLVNTASRSDQSAMLWLAVCRTYRLVREFAVEVVSERYESGRRDLPRERYDIFVHDKGEWDEWLAARSPSTVERSRQVLFKIMREAGLLDEQHQISPLATSLALRRLLDRAPMDRGVFPGGLRGVT